LGFGVWGLGFRPHCSQGYQGLGGMRPRRPCSRPLSGPKPVSGFQGFRVRGWGSIVEGLEICSGSEAGSYLRLIDSCITELKAQGPSRTCNESKEEEEETCFRVSGFGGGGLKLRVQDCRNEGLGLRIGKERSTPVQPHDLVQQLGLGFRVEG